MVGIKHICVSVSVLFAFAVLGLHGASITTNDVDQVLDHSKFAGWGWNEYRLALYRTFNRIDLDSGTNDMNIVKRHVFNNVLGLVVSTNTPGAASHLLAKADMIARAVDRLGSVLEEQNIRGILISAAGVDFVATNDLVVAYATAMEKDRALGWNDRNSRTGCSWNRPPNFTAWRNEKKRREEWNEAVAVYRQRMLEMVIRLLEIKWKNLEEGERKRAIKSLVESCGFTMPGESADDDI